MSDTDLQLLARYTRDSAEDAFAELVRRHLDLVHSAALRQVRSPQLAEEVAQSVFTDLARNSRRLAPDTILTAWLYQVTRRTAIDVVRREARRQLREQIATEMNAMNASASDWTHIEPLLDEAMHALDDTDRAAVLLRYFENKSLREVGASLGTSDDAAQKRVTRAIERLREFFTKRGVTIGAGGLAVVISANAVQAAPAGLAVTISAAAALAGTAIATATTATATQAIAMTALQKILIVAALTAAVGTGVYQAHQASNLRTQVQILQQQNAPLAAQIQQLQRERDDATNRLALLTDELRNAKNNNTELLKLRGEVTRLESDSQELALLKVNAVSANTNHIDDLSDGMIKREALTRLERMKEKVGLTPGQEQSIREAMLKRVDLIDQDMRGQFTGTLSQEEKNQLSQTVSNLNAQIDAIITPGQQAAYQAFQQGENATMARVHADGEFVMMQSLVGLGDDQQNQVFSVLYDFALKEKTGGSIDPAEKATALATILSPDQMEQYRKYLQGRTVQTQVQFPRK